MAHRVITAIGIEVQPLRAPGIKICAVIRRDKPAQFRVVISRIEVIEPRVLGANTNIHRKTVITGNLAYLTNGKPTLLHIIVLLK